MIPVKIRLEDGALVPEYQSNGAAGADLHARLAEPFILKAGETSLIPTGIYIEIPQGYEGQVRPRSGLALNHGITFLNSPGTIDSDYRGEVRVIMTNLGEKDFIIENGMRIGQIIFTRVYKADFTVVKEINKTERNEGGFGHSGL